MFLRIFTSMQTMWLGVRERFEDETGAVATEYALLLTLIALVMIGAVTALGLAISSKFSSACTTLGGSGC